MLQAMIELLHKSAQELPFFVLNLILKLPLDQKEIKRHKTVLYKKTFLFVYANKQLFGSAVSETTFISSIQ